MPLASSVILASASASVDPRTDMPDSDLRMRFAWVMFSEWLPGRTVPVGGLLYRGSVHGMTATAFHERCDNKGATLTLIRADVDGRVCVFGGFTSMSWSSVGKFVECRDAFLFSVTAGSHRPFSRFQVSAPPLSRQAMYCRGNYGPCFGEEVQILSGMGKANSPFDETSLCSCFAAGRSNIGASFKFDYNSVFPGFGEQNPSGATVPEGHFTPVEIEVYCVVPA